MIPYTTCQKCSAVLDATNSDINGTKHPEPLCSEKCCHLDHDADGKCSRHRGRGVLRRDLFLASVKSGGIDLGESGA